MTNPTRKKTELNALAKQFIAHTEAARKPKRPRDAAAGALHRAYKSAASPGASPSDNHIAGIHAASATAYTLLKTVTDPLAIDHLRAAIVRLGGLKDQLATKAKV